MVNRNLLKIKMLQANIDTFEKLAKRMGFTKESIYYKVSGKINWTVKDIKTIKEILNLNADDILNIFFN